MKIGQVKVLRPLEPFQSVDPAKCCAEVKRRQCGNKGGHMFCGKSFCQTHMNMAMEVGR